MSESRENPVSGNATVEMSLRLSPETNERLEKLSENNHMTISDLFRKSLALMEVALKNKAKGNQLAILDKNDKKISEITGL